MWLTKNKSITVFSIKFPPDGWNKAHSCKSCYYDVTQLIILVDILCMYDFTHTLLKIFTAWKKVIINNLLHFIFCGCNKIRPYSYTFNGEPNGSFLCKKTYPCILRQYALAWCCMSKIVTFQTQNICTILNGIKHKAKSIP